MNYWKSGVLACVLGSLVACGGSGGSGGGNPDNGNGSGPVTPAPGNGGNTPAAPDTPDVPDTPDNSGPDTAKVIDGYLENAVVCLDQNNNYRCDSGEPHERTDAQGNYLLEKFNGQLVLAEIRGGETKDNGVVVETGYILRGMAKKGENITPFSTLMIALKEAGENADTLEANLRQKLSLPADTDLTMDYVAENNQAMQKLAVMTVSMIQEINKQALRLDDVNPQDDQGVIEFISWHQLSLATLETGANILIGNPQMTTAEVVNNWQQQDSDVVLSAARVNQVKKDGELNNDDADGDGIANAIDNCPAVANQNQLDTDSDGQGDVCDTDDDNDGDLDTADNCPLIANSDQLDTDSDRTGDACDTDDDNDGKLDTADNCPVHANPDQSDKDNDNIGDACDTDVALKNGYQRLGADGSVVNALADAGSEWRCVRQQLEADDFTRTYTWMLPVSRDRDLDYSGAHARKASHNTDELCGIGLNAAAANNNSLDAADKDGWVIPNQTQLEQLKTEDFDVSDDAVGKTLDREVFATHAASLADNVRYWAEDSRQTVTSVDVLRFGNSDSSNLAEEKTSVDPSDTNNRANAMLFHTQLTYQRQNETCGSGYVRYNNRCYRKIDDAKNWADAAAVCTADDEKLVNTLTAKDSLRLGVALQLADGSSYWTREESGVNAYVLYKNREASQVASLGSNMGFEQDKSGWVGLGTPTEIRAGEGRNGSKGLFLGGQTADQQLISLKANTQYQLTAWAKGAGEVRIGFKDYGVAGETFTDAPTVANEWRKVSVLFTSNADRDVNVFVHNRTPNILFDDVHLSVVSSDAASGAGNWQRNTTPLAKTATHPFICMKLAPGYVLPTPAAPTAPVVSDETNTFGWTNVPGYDDLSAYEYSEDGGSSWKSVTANPQLMEAYDIAIGDVQVRIKEVDEVNNVGLILQSDAAFTRAIGPSCEGGNKAADFNGKCYLRVDIPSPTIWKNIRYSCPTGFQLADTVSDVAGLANALELTAVDRYPKYWMGPSRAYYLYNWNGPWQLVSDSGYTDASIEGFICESL